VRIRGFSLLEVLIAGIIFVVVVAGVVATWSTVTALQGMHATPSFSTRCMAKARSLAKPKARWSARAKYEPSGTYGSKPLARSSESIRSRRAR
jgi:Tfp pilus assembly protein PilV